MPTYEYECLTHGRYEMVRSYEDRDADKSCPTCGAPSRRVMSVPARSVVQGGTGAGRSDRT